ncbi:hypothetical protein Hdeb2414_s0010g00357601 [Helianthus debilis subsp. tardiflorus]
MSRPKAGPPLLIRIKEDQFYHGNQLARSKEVMSLYIIDLLIVLGKCMKIIYGFDFVACVIMIVSYRMFFCSIVHL